MKIDNYLDHEYSNLKSFCWSIWDDKNDTDTFEDIYQDTLLSCIERFEQEELECGDFRKYIVKAFKTNMLRRYEYSWYQTREDVEELKEYMQPCDDGAIEARIMLNEVLSYAESKGVKDLLLDYASGLTYKELAEKYHTSSVFYTLKNLREELQRLFIFQ